MNCFTRQHCSDSPSVNISYDKTTTKSKIKKQPAALTPCSSLFICGINFDEFQRQHFLWSSPSMPQLFSGPWSRYRLDWSDNETELVFDTKEASSAGWRYFTMESRLPPAVRKQVSACARNECCHLELMMQLASRACIVVTGWWNWDIELLPSNPLESFKTFQPLFIASNTQRPRCF